MRKCLLLSSFYDTFFYFCVNQPTQLRFDKMAPVECGETCWARGQGGCIVAPPCKSSDKGNLLRRVYSHCRCCAGVITGKIYDTSYCTEVIVIDWELVREGKVGRCLTHDALISLFRIYVSVLPCNTMNWYRLVNSSSYSLRLYPDGR